MTSSPMKSRNRKNPDIYFGIKTKNRDAFKRPCFLSVELVSVILNRVADPAFPNSVEGVLAQKNQFTGPRKPPPQSAGGETAGLLHPVVPVPAHRGNDRWPPHTGHRA